MSPLKVGLVALLAAVLSVVIAIFAQRWLDHTLDQPGAVARQGVALNSLPLFSLSDLEGHDISSDSWPGRVVVLHFWATWCPPCVRELPLLIEMQERLGDAVQMVGIAVDRKEDVELFIAAYPINYPILLANPEIIELSKQLGNRVEGLPFTAVFDRRGKRVFSVAGEVTAADLEAQLASLLGSLPPVRTREEPG